MSDIQKDVKATGPVDIITPANIQRMLQGIAAVKSLGITLREDLIQKLNEAKQAEDDFAASGIKDSVALHALQAEVKKAQEALDNYGNTMDKTKAKSETTWKSIEQDWHNGSNSMHATAELAGQSFNQISTAMTSAFTSAIMGQKNVGKAFEEATKQAVASLAAQALVKALFYTAEGFAALAMAMMGDPSAGAAATQYFTAAAEMAGIGAVAGAASRAMPGGGSGSNSNSAIQQNNNGSNTSGSNRGTVSVTGVQKFAEGGLVSAPTLAIVGDSLRGGQGSEAVLPLDHPESLAKIGAGLSAMGMGGGGGVHIHLPHGSVISADTMQKFVGKMNKMVNRGQLDLTASKSMRVNKRSA